MSTSTAVASPKTLFGYDVVSKIGDGACSSIYVVMDPKTSQVYALKHVIRKTDKDLRFIEQLQNEFEVSRHFRHPVLRKTIDLKVTKKLFGIGGISEAALIMELVDGTPLDQQPLLPIPRLLEVFTQVAQGLASLHHLRLVHCDFKPSNVIVCSDGAVKLIDFGQACKNSTVKDRVQGTPDFIAPEQVRLKAITFQTDIFCFGATLYWALTGSRIPTLYTAGKSEWRDVKEQKYPSPIELNPSIPERLSRLAMICSKISIGSRPENMNDVLQVLQIVATELPQSAPVQVQPAQPPQQQPSEPTAAAPKPAAPKRRMDLDALLGAPAPVRPSIAEALPPTAEQPQAD